MLMGSRPHAALAAATIDAVLAGENAPTAAIDDVVARAIGIQDAHIVAQRADLAATRVQFETQ